MRRFPKLLASVIVASVAATAPGQCLFGEMVAHPPADCHHHNRSPQPKPVDSPCCRAGHRTAILQKSTVVSARLLGKVVPLREGAPVSTSNDRSHYFSLSSSSAYPPGVAPLRI